MLYLVEARLGGELRNRGADLPEHLLRAEVVAFRVVHLDLKPLGANLWEAGHTDSVAVGVAFQKKAERMQKQGRIFLYSISYGAAHHTTAYEQRRDGVACP